MSSLSGTTVVVLGGTAGIGLSTARRARAAGANVLVTGRDEQRLKAAQAELGAATAVLDLADPAALSAFFAGLPATVDHVLLSGPGPAYGPISEIDFDEAARSLDLHLLGPLRVARECAARVRPGGSLTLISGTGARRPGHGLALIGIGTAALSSITANAALELAPLRVNTVAAGFVDTPLSARLLGDRIEERRAELRATLPVGRVVGPDDVADLILHLMTNEVLTGAVYDIDGGQQLLR
ncbi:SDR family oxidoreductase [Actinoplanes sp. L3-i22]|uniref:SDR family oxidoreductase n=1 Tax=Actinoplanes sp. L3-i22 TaxID=2836373 RepID=UPI001C74574B|nr:SDR family oxidoreductase [Actinoplanes sp. L3-i22]BCY08366.1 short-chain dehydrogenase [Actinoplanes sp. L3-i22]